MTQTQTGSTPEVAGAHAAAVRTGSIVIRRTIAATVDELFDAWLDPESLAQWMHPGTAIPSIARVDARVGGTFEVLMPRESGALRHHGEYLVIERNKKLVFTWFSHATHEKETLVTVEFHALDAGTQIVLTHERLPDHEAGMGHTKGWTAALNLLDEFLQH